MTENADKYLSQMLEGCEANLPQIEQAIAQLEEQRKNLLEQRDMMLTTSTELRALLGLDEEEAKETPSTLKLVSDEE